MDLRTYQTEAINETYAAWNAGAQNVLLQLATGGGKTRIFSHIIKTNPSPSVAIAHRMELVSQISLTLARHGVQHNIIAQKPAIREIIGIQMDELKRSYYNPGARVYVAGVDTLLRLPTDTPWFRSISLVVQDEGHHVLVDNKWGRAAALFPQARGLYPTATPVRADGHGLGRQADGIIDAMVIGVSMRELIRSGYLTDYRIFAPPSDLDLSNVTIAASGDYSPPKLRNAVHRSHITGDVVKHYLRIAPGQQGITFAVDIRAATEIAEAFRAAGVPAEVVTGETPDALRANILRRFRNGELKQLVNVDLFGEGFDLPTLSVVSMARPTQSFCLYSQSFGRALRPAPGKSHAIIIDHVGNVMRHGLPDAPRQWSLNRRDRRSRGADDVIPLRTCLNPMCMAVFPRLTRECPHCGFYTPPVQRSAPHHVDGDLLELDPEVLRQLRGEVARIDAAPRIPQHIPPHAQLAVVNKHLERQMAQRDLRARMAQWAGYLHADGMDDSNIYRRFYSTFGVDVATAQTLNAADASKLQRRIDFVIDGMGNNR